MGPAQLDLGSLESVRTFADAYRKSGKGLDVLVRYAVLWLSMGVLSRVCCEVLLVLA